jgi:hypothetical protein
MTIGRATAPARLGVGPLAGSTLVVDGDPPGRGKK